MADNTNQANNTAGGLPQPGSMPNPNQQGAEPNSGQPASPQGDSGSQGEGELTLPEGVSQRTQEQFDKLKEQLSEYKDKTLAYEQFLGNNPPPKPAPAAPLTPPKGQLYDPSTGGIYVEELEKRLAVAEQALKRADNAETKLNSYVEGIQTQEAVGAYPELNPADKDKFDPKFYRATRALIMDSMVYPESYGGRTLSYKEAATAAKEMSGQTANPNPSGQQESSREQGSLSVQGRPSQAVQGQMANASDEELRMRTRLGDPRAELERMKRIPTIYPDQHEEKPTGQ